MAEGEFGGQARSDGVEFEFSYNEATGGAHQFGEKSGVGWNDTEYDAAGISLESQISVSVGIF